MPKKKTPQPDKVSPYSEMDFPKQELDETFDLVKDVNVPRKEEVEEVEERDYLDDYNPQQNQNRNQSAPLMFNDENKDNLVANLLKVDWERIEHILRGHVPKIDNDGNEYFVKMIDHYLNERGINEILKFLSFYLTKDIKLARFSIEEKNLRARQFADEFTDFFFDNIEEFGLDTPEKKKMSKMFVRAVIDLVDASFSNAIEGKTIELMLKQFQVVQNQPLNEYGFSPNQNTQKPKVGMFQRIFG